MELSNFTRTTSNYGPKLRFDVSGDGFRNAIDRCDWGDETHHRNLSDSRWEIDCTPTAIRAVEREVDVEIPRDTLFPDTASAAFKIEKGSMFISIEDVHDGIMDVLRDELSYKAEYWDDNDKEKKTYREDVIFNEGIPIGLKSRVEDILEELDVDYIMLDYRKEPDLYQIDYEWNFQHELRDYQKETFIRMMQGSCVSELPTGAGKTICALRITQELGLPTIILVHQKDLLEQWRKQIQDILGVEPGIVQGDQMEFRDITVAMIPTLYNRVEENDHFVIDHYDMMITDECVHGESKIKMSDNSEKMIKDIEVGDEVMSYNESKEVFESKKVTETFVEDMEENWWRISYGGEELFVTSDHEVWTQGGWKEAQNLCEGDVIKMIDSHNQVKEVKEVKHHGNKSYDLTVEDNHNYIANKIVVHNCHHIPADQWMDVALNINAHYRYGLSATIEEGLRNDDQGIKIIAGIGPNDMRVSPEYLIENGYLAKPEFEWLYPRKYSGDPENWQEAYQEGIVDFEDRNNVIADKASLLLNEGRRVLVDVKRIEHGEQLLEMFGEGLVREMWDPNEVSSEEHDVTITFDPQNCASWPIPIVHDGSSVLGYDVDGSERRALENALEEATSPVVWVSGEDDSELREYILDQFRRGNINGVVSTLLREGVDVPELDAVILAGGGKSAIQLIQTIGRSLRPQGAETALIIDCKDEGPYIGQHARERYYAMNDYYGEYCEGEPY